MYHNLNETNLNETYKKIAVTAAVVEEITHLK